MPDANVYLQTVDVGTVVLEGDWNYAYDTENDAYYFLDRINSQDIGAGLHDYSMIRDLSYELVKCKDLVISGELNRTSDETIMEENLEHFIPLIDNPGKIQYINTEGVKGDYFYRV